GTVNVTGSGTSYTVTIANITGKGSIGINVLPGFATDQAGNTDAGSGPSPAFTVLSVDASLSSINPQYRPMTPAFRPLHYDYLLSVANGAKTIWVAPVTNDPDATMTVNGTAVTSGAQSTPV